MEENEYGNPITFPQLSTPSLTVSNYQGLDNYVKQRRIDAGNPQKMLNDDLYGKHTRAQGRVYQTKRMYELEKNAARKEALLNNLEEASAEMNSLANALNADANANYPFLEEYEAMLALVPTTVDFTQMVEERDVTEGSQTLACVAGQCEI